MHLTKANREIADSLDPIMGISDSKMSMETMRRNILVVFRAERPNSSEKAREIKHSPLLSRLVASHVQKR